ncbi:hypothetical protein T05_9863, partial [Trichinella murrelli]
MSYLRGDRGYGRWANDCRRPSRRGPPGNKANTMLCEADGSD